MRNPIKSAHHGGRLNLFLLEMIIVLLFFGTASAVILKTFVTADKVSAENMRLERMAFCAQSAAEAFSATADISEATEAVFGIDTNGIENATQLEIPLDDKCGYAYLSDASIIMTMQIIGSEYEGRLKTIRIFFEDKNGNLLYEINSAAYTPERTVLYGEE